MIDQIPDPHKGGMQCSVWPGPDQRRAGYGCDGMGWDGMDFARGEAEASPAGGDGEPAGCTAEQ
jgi:hypothetical protein